MLNPPDNCVSQNPAQPAPKGRSATDTERILEETRARLELALDLAQMGTWDL
ncbi:sensory box/GGDEF domain/EAL domain-containing protein, partial [Pseudomonas syringae pv. actinidiae ICMP 18807]